jgi:hypothetical protein
VVSARQGDRSAFIGRHNVVVTTMVGQVKAKRFKQRIRDACIEIHTERRKPMGEVLTANHLFFKSFPG